MRIGIPGCTSIGTRLAVSFQAHKFLMYCILETRPMPAGSLEVACGEHRGQLPMTYADVLWDSASTRSPTALQWNGSR